MTASPGFVFVTLFLLICVKSNNSAVYENIFVIVTSRLPKFYINGRPPTDQVFIKSANSLSHYINGQPLEIVIIQKQSITKLPPKSVSDLPEIVEVVITSCGIHKIESGAFQNVPKLLYLNLSNNFLEEINNGVFTGLQIESLDLRNNKISQLGDKAFNNMSLTFLNLEGNKISSWKSSWFRGTPVNTINMASNLLEEIPADAFDYISNSTIKTRVIFTGNRIRKIDRKAFRGVNHVGFVSLKNNALSGLPLDILNSTHISTLDLSSNNFKQLGEPFKYVNIDHLDLRHNKLYCLPFDFLNTSRIYYIYIEGNPIVCECLEEWQKMQERYYVKIVSWNNETCLSTTNSNSTIRG